MHSHLDGTSVAAHALVQLLCSVKLFFQPWLDTGILTGSDRQEPMSAIQAFLRRADNLGAGQSIAIPEMKGQAHKALNQMASSTLQAEHVQCRICRLSVGDRRDVTLMLSEALNIMSDSHKKAACGTVIGGIHRYSLVEACFGGEQQREASNARSECFS